MTAKDIIEYRKHISGATDLGSREKDEAEEFHKINTARDRVAVRLALIRMERFEQMLRQEFPDLPPRRLVCLEIKPDENVEALPEFAALAKKMLQVVMVVRDEAAARFFIIGRRHETGGQ
jgi:hypothetical protein